MEFDVEKQKRLLEELRKINRELKDMNRRALQRWVKRAKRSSLDGLI